MGRDEINILDQAVMSSFKLHLEEVKSGKMVEKVAKTQAQVQEEAQSHA